MDPHELPPELDRWPTDPCELLGVSWDVAPRDLKRAYTQLIRVYKPEQFPEHFRRLREAYETILRHVGHRQTSDQTGSKEPQLIIKVEPQPAGAETHTAATSDWAKTLREAWELACSGLDAAAYERFRALHDERPGDADVCARLYWLLALSPELDAGRTPEDWLVDGMLASGLSGPLGELYRREMLLNPAEAASDRCSRLFQAPASPGVLAGLVETRWRAIALDGDAGPIVAEDIERLRRRLEHEDESTWFGLLLTAMGHLLWSEAATAGLVDRLKAEIESNTYLHRRMDQALTRLDILTEVAKVWRRLAPDLPAELVMIVRQSWLQEFSELRPRLETSLMHLLRDPTALLEALGTVATQSSLALMAFDEPLFRWHSAIAPISEARSKQQLSQLVCDFLKQTNFFEYRSFRPHLLEFCLRESLVLEQFEAAIGELGLLGLGVLAEAIRRDLPLRYTARAHRLFWA